MPINIQDVADRINMEEVARNAIRKLSSLYSKSTHFVYELVQNASDADSRYLQLELNAEAFTAQNEGRIFNENDILAVCTVSESRKDLTQIGTHGIGFKAVYWCTDCPHIYSGPEWFCIQSYVRPEALKQIPSRMHQFVTAGGTAFVLPFKEGFSKEDRAKIAQQLRELNRWTLLFLGKTHGSEREALSVVEWKNGESGESGRYLRTAYEDDPFDGITRVVLSARAGDESFLLFRTEVLPPQYVIDDLLRRADTAKDEERIRRSANQPQPVEIAFAFRDGQLVPLLGSVLFSYLPTQVSTSLRFLIQARYQTTPARDNIIDSEGSAWNDWLIAETARFLPNVLLKIREVGLLGPRFFDIMPVPTDVVPDNVRHIFEPIRKAVITAARDGAPLIPKEDGTFALAGQVFYPYSDEIRELFRGNLLAEFTGLSEAGWLHQDVPWRDRTQLFLSAAGVQEVRARTVAT